MLKTPSKMYIKAVVERNPPKTVGLYHTPGWRAGIIGFGMQLSAMENSFIMVKLLCSSILNLHLPYRCLPNGQEFHFNA